MKFDAKGIALLAVLVAVNSTVRTLGAGIAGVETVFALVVLTGAVYGSIFGASLGALSILVSALVAGGIGPWMPFQLIAASLVGLGAGLIPAPTVMRPRLIWLCGYAAVSSYVYGLLMTAWTWPLFLGNDSPISFQSDAPLMTNLKNLVIFDFTTGGFLWNTGRAITTIVLILVMGKALISTLERAKIRAFAEFED